MALTRTVVLLFSIIQYTTMAQSNKLLRDALANLTTAVESADEGLETIADLLNNVLDSGHVSTGVLHQHDECYKGMASLNKPTRTLVTIPGNRTALCDTVTDEGEWIVIQRRSDGKEDFYRNWEEYKSGFGDIAGRGDYWLGNEIIHQLTWTRTFELRVDMVHQGQKYFAHYSSFYLGDETTKYTLHIGKYNGDAGDMLTYHNNMKFSTYDMENDLHTTLNCAVVRHSAWWYNACYYSQLNAVWEATDHTGINWGSDSKKRGLSFTEMKIRLI